jgi:hypothetical protein
MAFHLDDFGARLGEHQSRERARQERAEIENPNTV